MRTNPSPLLLVGVLLLLALPTPGWATPLLTEFMTNNNTGILDEESTHQDWIEVHNPDAVALDLGGYHLTDTSTLLTKWTVPAGFTIPAHGYAVIFASNKDRVVLGAPLHTNFSLSSAGEYLALIAPDGTTVLTEYAPTFPVQTADVSYGLTTPVAGSPRAYFTTPTPGAANNPAFAPADAVLFSVSSRTFNQGATFPVSLSVPSATAVVRYTLNRAVPLNVASAPRPVTAAVTDVLTMVGGHDFMDLDPVQFSTTGTLPAPLVAGTTYYVLYTNTFTAGVNDPLNYKVAATPGGTAVDITTVGTGVINVSRQPSAVYTGALTVGTSQRIRARAFETGRPDGPVTSATYIMLDTAAQAFTSNLPIMLLHSFGSGHPSTTAAVAGVPEDTKKAVWFIFEPKLPDNLARMTNLPDLAVPGYFERRGSSTFAADKYSMTMGAYDETDQGTDVSPLGFPSNDDFVLNAHFQFDRSLMHNDLIYRLSNEIGRYAPRTRHVEVFSSVANDVAAVGAVPGYGIVNGTTTGSATVGDYYGVYSFQDKISRGNNRVDIEKLTTLDNTAPNVQGGYIFKIDRLDAGDTGVAGAGRTFALTQPKERTSVHPNPLAAGYTTDLVATTQQKAYLTTTLNNMYAALTGVNSMSPTLGYAAHLNVAACIDHHILGVAPKSADAFRLSGYWYKSRYGKLAMGPIFDFDRAMGSTDGRDLNPLTWRGDIADLGTDWFHASAAVGLAPNYFESMFADPNFWQAWIDRLQELRNGALSTAHVHAIINEYTELLDPGNAANTAAKRNFIRWTATPPRGAAATTPGTDGTFRGEATFLKNWWGKAGAVTANGRLDFMDGQFMRPTTATPGTGPVAPNSTVALTSPSLATSGVKIYYTTNGTDPRPTATTSQVLAGTLTQVATFLPEISTVRSIVPTSLASGGGAAGTDWRGADLNANGNNQDDFNDATWLTNAAGTINGVGYDDSTVAPAVNYLPFLSVRWNTAATATTLPVAATNVMRASTISSVAYAGNQTCYIRWPFTLTASDMALIGPNTHIVLQVRYDDGFVCWLNGTELTNARANAPATSSLAFNSAASTTHADADSITYEAGTFDVTAFIGSLHLGANVLAMQGLNSGLGSSDALWQPRLLVQNIVPTSGYTPAIATATGATEYTAPISITAPTQIFARTLSPLRPSDPPTQTAGGTGTVPNGSGWSAPTKLYYFPGAVAASLTGLQISEVLYHPLDPTAAEISAGYLKANAFEFIRLTNTSAGPLDLTGIYFSLGVNFTAVPGLQNWLPAGQSVVVVDNRAAFMSRYGSSFTILGEFSGDLDDGGETITLNDATGAVIATFTYNDKAPWPVAADAGASLLYRGGAQTAGASWTASVDAGGSAATSYAVWSQRHFTSATPAADQLPGADPDQDGLNNLGEYAFATDPLAHGGRESALTSTLLDSPGSFSVIRRRGATGLTYLPQSSSTLQTWDAIPTAPVLVDLKDGTETATWTLPAGPTSRVLVRVFVTAP